MQIPTTPDELTHAIAAHGGEGRKFASYCEALGLAILASRFTTPAITDAVKATGMFEERHIRRIRHKAYAARAAYRATCRATEVA